jgi:hypothetical protein
VDGGGADHQAQRSSSGRKVLPSIERISLQTVIRPRRGAVVPAKSRVPSLFSRPILAVAGFWRDL